MKQTLLPKAPKFGPNKALQRFVDEAIKRFRPKAIQLCNGSQGEFNQLIDLLVENNTAIRLNQKLWPDSILVRSHPSDVARLEHVTYVCLKNKDDAGPTVQHMDPEVARQMMEERFDGDMEGRTMYIVACNMGPVGGRRSRTVVQITDSPYAVANLHIMTRVLGRQALNQLGDNFVPALHSVGMPLKDGVQDVPWPCNVEKLIFHFPEEKTPGVARIMSRGSGYGGNANLPKKCDLRLGMFDAREEGDALVEHKALIGRRGRRGDTKYFLAAKPSQCGKTNFAMIGTTFLGDDLVRVYRGADGQAWAFALEVGVFGVAPGTSDKTNLEVMNMLRKGGVIFTNVAYLPQAGDVWWEGMSDAPPPGRIIDWQGQEWTPGCGRDAAQANSRFTVSITNCSKLDPNWDNPDGVPIAGELFGGRREESGGVPLVVEYDSIEAAVYGGGTLTSGTTAAAAGKLGVVRIDPFAMRPFYAYHVGDHYAHWLKFLKSLTKPPRFYGVNWFQKTPDGKWSWPGYQDNDRVLDFIDRRIDGEARAIRTPLGWVPAYDDFNLSGLNISADQFKRLTTPNPVFWLAELDRHAAWFAEVGDRVPHEFHVRLAQLRSEFRLAA